MGQASISLQSGLKVTQGTPLLPQVGSWPCTLHQVKCRRQLQTGVPAVIGCQGPVRSVEVLVSGKRQEREDRGPKPGGWGGAGLGKMEKEWAVKSMHIQMASSFCGLDRKKTEEKTLATALHCERWKRTMTPGF